MIPETQLTNPELGKPSGKTTPVDIALEKSMGRVRELLAGTDDKIANFKIKEGALKINRDSENGLHIYNWKELGFPKMPKNLSEADIVNYLTELGYFEKLEKQAKGEEPIPKVKATLTAEQQKRAAELKAKYGY